METKPSRTYRNRHNTGVGLADLIEATVALEDHALERVVDLCGFQMRHPDDPDDDNGDVPEPKEADKKTRRKRARVSPKRHDPNPASETHEDRTIELIEPEFSQEILIHNVFGDYELDSDDVLPVDSDVDIYPPIYEPLLNDRWFRGLVTALFATPNDSNQIDYSRLQRMVIAGKPLDRLPLMQRLRMQDGLQVFLDRSDSMLPFWHDSEVLVYKLGRVIGTRSMEVHYFEKNPLKGVGIDPAWDWQALQGMTLDRPVLFVTDFGMTANRTSDDLQSWTPVVEMAQAARCEVTVLIPVPEFSASAAEAPSWPTGLRHLIPRSFVWDRETSPQIVRRRTQRSG